MANRESGFEARLRSAIPKVSRTRCADAIREVVEHHQDLYQEAIAKGATVEESRKYADENMGNIEEIAKGIRDSKPKLNGIRLQWMAMALWFLGIFIPIVMAMNGVEIGSLRGNIIEAAEPIGLITVYVAGFVAAVGVLRARRGLILAFCLTTTLIVAVHTGILLRNSRSFSTYDAKMKARGDNWHQYAVTYRPILTERYSLYAASITGTQQQSDDAIRKLSSIVKRPQDRGVDILDGETGKWIYPLKDDEVRKRNIRVFPFSDDNLNSVFFGATDSFEVAQKAWRSSDDLLKALPILRKGSEAEFARTSSKSYPTARGIILGLSVLSAAPFLVGFLVGFLTIGAIRAISKLLPGRRKAL